MNNESIKEDKTKQIDQLVQKCKLTFMSIKVKKAELGLSIINMLNEIHLVKFYFLFFRKNMHRR